MQNTTTELEIFVSGGRIIQAYVTPEGKCKLVIDTNKENILKDVFAKIEASKLSLEDEFMKYNPSTGQQRKLKNMIENVIQQGIEDFWTPIYAPSLNAIGTGIYYGPDRRPAVGRSYNWWETAAREYAPEFKSRLGIISEFVAFLAVLIKELIKSGVTAEKAWNAVCNDSKELGHFSDSSDSKHEFETTGSREVCGFFDLGNTCKILAEYVGGKSFWTAGGCYLFEGSLFPLSDFSYQTDCNSNNANAVGWIVCKNVSSAA